MIDRLTADPKENARRPQAAGPVLKSVVAHGRPVEPCKSSVLVLWLWVLVLVVVVLCRMNTVSCAYIDM